MYFHLAVIAQVQFFNFTPLHKETHYEDTLTKYFWLPCWPAGSCVPKPGYWSVAHKLNTHSTQYTVQLDTCLKYHSEKELFMQDLP